MTHRPIASLLCFHFLLVVISHVSLPPAFAQNQAGGPPAAVVMTDAATSFLETLDPASREAASFPFDDAERLNWHFIPRERKGLPLREMDKTSKQKAHALVAAGLSDAGYGTTLQVMSLEEVLYLFEEGEEEVRRERRDPHKYYVSIFGTPSKAGTWGWRFEGHHLSLNYVISNGKIVSSTPQFFGSNPGLINGGPGRSLRVLGRREFVARKLLESCSEDQQAVAWVSKEAPDDIRGGGVAQPVVSEAVGLRFADMNMEQQQMLRQIIGEYVKAMPAAVVRQRMNAIREHGMDEIRFAWSGSNKVNERHHYVIQGESFIIEYNNTQNSANHVHSIWRNLGGDFNVSTAGAE